jgi:gamma-glutamylcyclotransferase (GGCT)/AIG2-like uncharacterized protein YtfP
MSRERRSIHVRRLPILLALCALLGVLVVGFGAQFNGSPAYPSSQDIGDQYAAHVGDDVHLWGEVVGMENGLVVLEIQELSLAVTSPSPRAVDVGDSVQVYGTLEPDRRLETVAYHRQTAESLTRMYAVSVVGLALAAGAFLRRWRIDTETWQFAPRNGAASEREAE